MKNLCKAIFVIIGSIIGAGFASGKEIYLFFNTYGLRGMFGIIIANILLAFVIYYILKLANKYKINTYKELLHMINLKNNTVKVLNRFINILLVVSFYIMIAGFCSYFKQEFNVEYLPMSIIISILCFKTLLGNSKSLYLVNIIIIPILLFLICLIGYKMDININIFNKNEFSEIGWFFAALKYTGYNLIMLIPVLISIRESTLENEKIISIIVGFIFIILALVLYLIMDMSNINIKYIDLPIVYIVSKLGVIYKYLYGVIIVCAIFTSAISSGFAFLNNISKNEKNYKLNTCLLCFSSIMVSRIGFSNMVEILYPLIGVIGMCQFIFIMYKTIYKSRINV